MLFSKWFGRKEMDVQAAEAFWHFFEREQAHFMQVLSGYDSGERQQLISAVDQVLCPIFPYEKPENIGFQLGYCNGTCEFIMFHSGLMPLATDMHKLCEMMPQAIRNTWSVTLSE